MSSASVVASHASWPRRLVFSIGYGRRLLLPQHVCFSRGVFWSRSGLSWIGKQERAQMIDFPNHSRSYDATRRVVRFWGHDSAIEAAFFISQDALTRIQPDVRLDESGLLNAFDANREKICAAAARVYVRGGRGWYDLGPTNF
jgi:hypothetical protein